MKIKQAQRPTSANKKSFVSGGVYNPNAMDKPMIQEPSQSTDPVPVAGAISVPVPMPFILKEEPMNEVGEEEGSNQDLSMDINVKKGNGRKIPFKLIFQKRKKPSERNRDKKLRRNRQLRKSLLPKNALKALNEIKGVTIGDFTIDKNPDGGFTAIVTVNSKQYEGKGLSKMTAKNDACEKAWRDFIIAKLQPSNVVGGEEPMETNENDDLPMLNLASFAIYKLFGEWQRQGFDVPEMGSLANAAAKAEGEAAPPKKPLGRTELPSGWESMHPASILSLMRPGLIYVDQGASGEKPNVLQNLGITVDNQEFTAYGKNKKIARRNVAVKVCNTLFGTNFTESDTSS
ncbi:uncharacterized protein LOC108116818 [Drosophila eugracilis]|uniref:uncharacterized protein LOC108116818 n=1 Tax=Drosophila eugracilis TaxID=29029 RepID=UPI001BDA2D30|nr:uncharacterized protein LOC108116818 [Drosophila eugracilis]